jgi:hypothetical protein
MTNIEMNYVIKSILDRKHGLQAMMIVPVLGVVAFAGCSNLDGTAERQPQTKNGMTVYSEWRQEKSQQADANLDPVYEWFY